VLADAARGSGGFAAFEGTSRSVRAVLMLLLTPMFVLLLTPLIRPFTWPRAIWTYLIPLIPLGVFFDGIVSCLRSYTADELRQISAGVANDRFEWHAGSIAGGILPLTYLIGIPRTRISSQEG
jgi:hypothetical protein